MDSLKMLQEAILRLVTDPFARQLLMYLCAQVKLEHQKDLDTCHQNTVDEIMAKQCLERHSSK